MLPTRRLVLRSSAAIAAGIAIKIDGAVSTAGAAPPPTAGLAGPGAHQSAVERRFGLVEQRRGGRLGVFALDTATGMAIGWRADERFPMQSTFKGPLVACVLARVDNGSDGLDAVIRFGPAAIVEASPVTARSAGAPGGGAMTVAALIRAVLERSDNTAANLLLRRIGGPPALDAFLRTLGDTVTRCDSFEPITTDPGNERDTTTPRALATTMRVVLLGRALAPASRALMVDAMRRNVPGRTRLAASLPAEWRTADRSGTADGVCNDVAIGWPPGRAPVMIAAFGDHPGATLEQGEATLREVGAIAEAAFAGRRAPA